MRGVAGANRMSWAIDIDLTDRQWWLLEMSFSAGWKPAEKCVTTGLRDELNRTEEKKSKSVSLEISSTQFVAAAACSRSIVCDSVKWKTTLSAVALPTWRGVKCLYVAKTSRHIMSANDTRLVVTMLSGWQKNCTFCSLVCVPMKAGPRSLSHVNASAYICVSMCACECENRAGTRAAACRLRYIYTSLKW